MELENYFLVALCLLKAPNMCTHALYTRMWFVVQLSPEFITNICMQGKFLTNLSFASQTIPDCINLLLVSFEITLNHRRTFLLHINTLAYVKAEILTMIKNLHFSYIVQNRSGIVMFTYSIL